MKQAFIFLLLAGFSILPASAATIFVPTFTAGFDSAFGANAAAAKAAWIAAAGSLSAQLTDNIHINILVDGVTGSGTLGASNTPITAISSFNALYAAMVGDATSAADTTTIGAGGSLASGVDPVSGAHNWWLTRAQQKALGLLSDDGVTDGTVTFGSGFTYTFSGAIAAGSIDFQGVVLHEISEIMGRIGLSGSTVSGSAGYTLLDAYSFASPGVRTLGNGANANFSINAGAILLKAFNNQFANGGDSRDWAAGTNDSFNAFSTSGTANSVSAVDLQLLDVLGYNLASTPEPSSIFLMSGGLLGLFYFRRRRTRP